MDHPVHQINELPLQILRKVVSFLKFDDRQAASMVCTTWYEATQAPQFLESTCVRLSSNEDDWETLDGICKRKIPNLLVDFEEDHADKATNISPEIARHSELASSVKYLYLCGHFIARDVIFCIRHFKNLRTLKVDPHYKIATGFFGDDKLRTIKSLTALTDHLPALMYEAPLNYMEEDLIDWTSCFTRAKDISVTCAVSSPSLGFLTWVLTPGDDFVRRVLKQGGMISRLKELDLRWCHLSHQSLKDLVNIPQLKLQTFRFISRDDNCCLDLESLRDSPMTPTNLEILCQREKSGGTAAVGYPEIRSLLTKKPSIKHLKYFDVTDTPMGTPDPRVNLENLLQEWPNVNELTLVGMKVTKKPEVELHFQCYGNFVTLCVWTSRIDDTAMVKLADRSPGLKAITLWQEFPQLNFGNFGMPIIVNSFSLLTRLVLIKCDLSNVDFSVAGPSPISKLTRLEIISLGYCRSVTDSDLVVHHLPCLTRLVLANCSDITDAAVISIAATNPTLRLLDLSGCTQLTDIGIAAVAKYLNYLRCIFLIDCGELTDGSVKALLDGCGMLRMVDATGCDQSFIGALERQKLILPYLGSIKTGTDREQREKDYHQDPILDKEYYA